MYVDTCEATHLRGEQSADVLDLRMSCLNERLDEFRALIDALARADVPTVGQAAIAIQSLEPVARCADTPTLRSAIRPPRDEKTAETVRGLQRSLRDAVALDELGNERAALAKALEVKSTAEAIGYKPLLAEVLLLVGSIQGELVPEYLAKGLLS